MRRKCKYPGRESNPHVQRTGDFKSSGSDIGSGWKYDEPAPAFANRRDATTIIYAIGRADTREIKIGRASDVARRMKELQTAHGEPLQLLVWFRGTPCDERELHHYFGDHHKLGEWFHDCPKIRDWIERQRLHNLLNRGFE